MLMTTKLLRAPRRAGLPLLGAAFTTALFIAGPALAEEPKPAQPQVTKQKAEVPQAAKAAGKEEAKKPPTEDELLGQAQKALPTKPAEARALYLEVTKRNPNNLGAWRGLVAAYAAEGKAKLVEQTQEKVIALDAKDRETRLALAKSYTEGKRWRDVARVLKQAHELRAFEETADLVAYGRALERSGDELGATKVLSQVAATPAAAKDKDLQLDVARKNVRAKDGATAGKAYERVFAVDPKHVEAATFLFKGADKDSGPTYAEVLVHSGSKDPAAYLVLGAAAEAKNDAKAALTIYGDGVKAAPRDRDLALRYGRALGKKGDLVAARPYLDQGLRDVKDASGTDLRLLLDAELAAKLNGRATARRVLAVDPKDATASRIVGLEMFQDPKARAKALPFLERGLEVQKPDAIYVFQLAEASIAAKDQDRAERYLTKTLELEPKHDQAALLLGEAVLAKGDTARAMKLLAQASKTRPNDERLHRVLAEGYRKLGDAKAEEAELKEVVRLKPADGAAHGTLGKLQYARGATDEARPHLEAALRVSPDDQALLLPLVELAWKRGDAKATSEHAARILRRSATNATALRLGGLALEKLGKNKDAEKLLAQVKDTSDVDVQAALGRARVALGDLAGAEAPLGAAAAARPKDAELNRLHALTLVRLEKFDAATKAGERALAVGAADASLLSAIGYAYYRTGDAKRSNDLLTRAEAKGAKESYIPLVKGENFFKSGDLPAAKAAFTEASRRDPKSGPANFFLGKIAFQQNDKKKAIEHLSKAVAENPSNVEAQELLGRAALELKDYKTAQAALQKVPMAGKAELLTLRGLAESGAGDPRAAERSFKEALDADPNYYAAVVARGDNYLKLPHWDKAKELFEQAAKLRPNDPEPVARLAKLYEEAGDTKEAAKAKERIERLELQAAAERRKEAKPGEIIQVGIGNFTNNTPTKDLPELSILIPEELTAEFSRIGKIEVLDRVSLAQRMKAINEQMKMAEDVGLENLQQLTGKIQGMRMAVVGSYIVLGDKLTISAKILDETAKVKKASSRTGLLADRGEIQRKVALELAGEAVPLDPADVRALSRPASTSDLGVGGKLAAAREAELRGDVRAARALYQEALKMDADNAELIKKVKANEEHLKERNRLGVDQFHLTAATLSEPWVKELGGSIREVISSKLAASGSVNVVDDPRLQDVFKNEFKLVAQEEEAKTEGQTGGVLLDPSTMANLETLDKKLNEELKVSAIVLGTFAISGDRVTIAAKLRDTTAKKDLVTVTEDGNVKDVLDVENRTAEKLLRALLGTPTDEEMAKMRASQEYKDYQEYIKTLGSRVKKEPEKLAEKEPEKVAPKEPEKKPEEIAKVEPEKKPEEPPVVIDHPTLEQPERTHLGYRGGVWLGSKDVEASDGRKLGYGTPILHSIVFGWDHDHSRNEFVFSFLKQGADQFMELGGGNAEFPTLRMWRATWELDLKLIGGDPLFNLYLGVDLGGMLIKETPGLGAKSAYSGDEDSRFVLVAEGHGGVMFNPFSWFTLYGQVGYDYPFSVAALQGLTLSVGTGIRL